MDRRDFLKTTGTVVAATAIASSATREAGAAAHSKPVRAVLPINRRWRYSAKATPEAHERAFDDSKFTRVTVPHTNIRLPWHGFDEKAYEFVSIYRRHFKMPAEARGRRVFVDFEGVMTASTVWLNGVKLGEYKGGYTPFSFELSEHLDWAGDNVLAVEVDSRERADIPPFGNVVDYLTFGGIYR
jgi:beta-galactosidase